MKRVQKDNTDNTPTTGTQKPSVTAHKRPGMLCVSMQVCPKSTQCHNDTLYKNGQNPSFTSRCNVGNQNILG